MALAQKAKQQSKGMGAKTVKPPAKVAKSGKKVAVVTKPKAKSAAEQPQKQLIEKAKAALKRENTAVVVTAPVQTQVVAPAKVPAPVKAPAPVKISKAKARKISIEASANEAASALVAKWTALNKKADQIDTKPYSMKAVFEEKTAIVHKLLGWGYILANRNDRLEVLFKDGIKHLISNYKP
jgi:hypothetical protein